MEDERTCCCPVMDPYDCISLRYNLPRARPYEEDEWGNYYVPEELDACECECHYQSDEDDGDEYLYYSL